MSSRGSEEGGEEKGEEGGEVRDGRRRTDSLKETI